MISILPLAIAAAASASSCEPMPGWDEIARETAGRYLVLGETHGSAEAPAATAELVCALAQNGPVLVGIEFSSSGNAAWQRAWAAPHSEFRERLLEEVPDWGKREDGVASAAMLAMLVRLHALKDTGAAIDIVAFNGARDVAQRAAFAELPGQEPHEAAQAANIREAAQARDYAHVVVLVGSFHAGKQALALGPVDVRPMATLLAPAERIIALKMHTEGGETWSCQLDVEADYDPTKPITDDMLDCSAHPVGASQPSVARGFHIDADLSGAGYDGVFALGPVTASPPPPID